MNSMNSESTVNYTCGKMVTLRLTDLNPTCMDLVVIILGYIVPVLAVLVIIINSLIIAVFMKPRMRSHTTMILSMIALVDMLNIMCPSATYVYHYSFNNYTDFLHYPFCKLAYFLADTCVDMLNMISLWLTVMLAYIRSKCLKSPFSARRTHSGHRIAICVSGIVIMALLIHIPSYFIFGFHPMTEYDSVTNKTEVICGIREADVTFYITTCAGRKIHVFIECVLDSILPCAILVYYNVIMFLALQKAMRHRTSLRLSRTNSQKEHLFAVAAQSIKSSDKPKTGDESEGNRDTFRESTDETENRHKLGRHRNKNRFGLRLYHRDTRNARESSSADAGLEKLDRESRRTSCIILILATVVVSHEIPRSLMNIYILISHSSAPLPLNMNGCMSVIMLLGQYVTYPVIFLIYSCMSGSFRTEIWKALTCIFVKHDHSVSNTHKIFLSPCSVRKISRNDETTIEQSDDSSDDE